MRRHEAEKKLSGSTDGTFLVRDSSDVNYLLSLSFRSVGKTYHTRIEYRNGKNILLLTLFHLVNPTICI